MKGIFLIAGFQRSGSTFLHNLLDAHPEIKMNNPVRPEPKFYLQNDITKSDLEDYLSTYFSGDNEGLILGEKSTSYVENVASIKQFIKWFPQGKVLLIMRDPVDRTISNYKFSLENGLETRTPKEVFIDNTPAPTLDASISVNPFEYIERSHYASYIKAIKPVLPENQLHLTCFEDLLQEDNAAHKLFDFLNVTPVSLSHKQQKKVNSSSTTIEIPDQVREKLKIIFENSFKELKEITNLEFKYWNL